MSVITKDLGIATAYGYAKSKGYTGTEEEFAELMASYADVAQQAEAAAQDAEDAKDEAVTAKTDAQAAKTAAQAAQSAAETASGTATTKASEAAQSAQSAAGSASAAQTSATAASGSASTAQTAAQTATNKASEASSSASAASTAKTGAETARTGAQTAQTAAETAQANAEASASSVSASAAQIEQNTEDIAGLKNDLNQFPSGTYPSMVVGNAKGLATSLDTIATLSGSYTPSYIGSYKAYNTVLSAGHKYLMILVGTNVVGSTTMQLMKNGSWVSGTNGRIPFNSGYYKIFEPVEENCLPAFYNTVSNITIDYYSQLYDVTDLDINAEVVEIIYQFSLNPVPSFEIVTKLNASIADNIWYGKNVLAIGDSLTAGGEWVTSFVGVLGSIAHMHSKGGLGMVQLVNGERGIDGDYTDTTLLKPLSVDDVTGKDLIIFYAGYNDRGKPDGDVGDVFDPSDNSGNTIAGLLQYVINRIYEVLASANNLTCRIAIITPHCAGKYQYINADGYTEYPSGTGRTMLTMANIMADVANYNSLPCLNLWKTSGINKNTWNVFSASPTPTDPNGTGNVPYPQNRDQLHLCNTGYVYLGKRIADWVKGI